MIVKLTRRRQALQEGGLHNYQQWWEPACEAGRVVKARSGYLGHTVTLYLIAVKQDSMCGHLANRLEDCMILSPLGSGACEGRLSRLALTDPTQAQPRGLILVSYLACEGP